MPEPLSIIASSFGIASSGLTAAVNLLKLAQEFKDVPEDSKVFVRVLDQVNHDLQYAAECYEGVSGPRSGHPSQNRWILEVVEATFREVDDFGCFVGHFDEIRSPDFGDRVKYILKDYKALVDREKALLFAHSRLLTAIGTMHFMALQLGPSNGSLSPVPPKPLRRKASRAPPQGLASITGVASKIDGERIESVVISVEKIEI
ncbi:hypothetical protein F5Y05DRAFT_364421 [Hypoxylon sp. FL0543]|nr:hypothetical protein F5Y05DRAFT_364421 [Hypoxylon sp. FL0543]